MYCQLCKIVGKWRTVKRTGYDGRRLPRTQARSSGLESDWDFNFTLGIVERAKIKVLTLPSVLCRHAKHSPLCSLVSHFPHLRRPETRQGKRALLMPGLTHFLSTFFSTLFSAYNTKLHCVVVPYLNHPSPKTKKHTVKSIYVEKNATFYFL